MLLFNGHESHVTLEAVQYCKDNKVILLCLPSHSTHILQPLDIGVFSPLAISYWKFMFKETEYGASYSIDKILFLQILQKAREEALNSHNISSS
jgi:hypothetical protein